MKCFSCFSSSKKKDERDASTTSAGTNTEGSSSTDVPASSSTPGNSSAEASNTVPNIATQKFTFRELEIATKLFLDECVIGEGGFGKVYKGTLERTGQVVAVKHLNLDGAQGSREFLNEVSMLSHLQHQNLVNLVGYCSEGDQKLLVYEYMPSGSVEDHLFDLKRGQQPLDWFTRMRIAFGAAEGLEYLHDKVDPPVIFRDLKASNILLDGNFNPKLSDFGLAKIGPVGNNTHVSTMIAGTYGYCAPEYAMTGHLKVTSDVYSFGVVLLELISGRRAFDDVKPTHEKSLVVWAKPMLGDQTRYPDLIDPLIKNDYPPKGLKQAVAIAAICLQEKASNRPRMCDVAMALEPITVADIESPSPRSSTSSVPPLPDETSAAKGTSTSGSHNA
ncbi:hypothetical protein LUZ63_017975 [Rhynchospora breviuscula]|uniref:Protein kinase domain-containing protein n=1 Tax=Rhynchospora breviuscula TaxID=2022672 RepID=A0A9Q0C3K6_9POAL|nr:hypothetical protein LUZ63_017975 [Rhynchospora breviuscula]